MAQLGMVLYHGIDSGPELKTYGHIAEDLGYDSLWVTERYFRYHGTAAREYCYCIVSRRCLL
jgi:alkanesulfonate monooxygenase SsuD/methylene tetrahydromethanopterin reductase-like flavin-dependent oxidoreductase (luciferase family)